MLTAMTSPRHYLLVDDSLEDQFLAQEAFEQLCPEGVLTCVGNGMKALAVLNSPAFEPDLVLLDLNMPGMSGFEVLGAMKADPRLVQIPVVILSTSNNPKDVELAYRLHASSYLVKPASFDGFLELLKKVLGYWQLSRTVRDLTMDGD